LRGGERGDSFPVKYTFKTDRAAKGRLGAGSKVVTPLCISPNLEGVAKSPKLASEVPSPRGRRTPATFCDAVKPGEGRVRLTHKDHFLPNRQTI